LKGVNKWTMRTTEEKYALQLYRHIPFIAWWVDEQKEEVKKKSMHFEVCLDTAEKRVKEASGQ